MDIKKALKGFTLVELLVVISIIALLLSILMPSFKKAREQAQKIICASNEKQVSLGLDIYAYDNKDVVIPDCDPAVGTSGYGQAWDSMMASSFATKKNDSLKKYLVCPYDKKVRVRSDDPILNQYQGENVLPRSYALNVGLLNATWLTGPELRGDLSDVPPKTASVFQPAATIRFMEFHVAGNYADDHSHPFGNTQGGTAWTVYTLPYVANVFLNSRRITVGDMHRDGGNWAFVDGHSAWYGFIETGGRPVNFIGQSLYKGLVYPNNWRWQKQKKF